MDVEILKEISTDLGDHMALKKSGGGYIVEGWADGKFAKKTKSLRAAKAYYREVLQEYFACRMDQ